MPKPDFLGENSLDLSIMVSAKGLHSSIHVVPSVKYSVQYKKDTVLDSIVTNVFKNDEKDYRSLGLLCPKQKSVLQIPGPWSKRIRNKKSFNQKRLLSSWNYDPGSFGSRV
jgi:hypothetical protein